MMTKKRAIVLGAVAVLAVAAVAIAYFSSTGSGTGTATVGTSSNVEITGTTSTEAYPEGPAVPVSITVKNPGKGSEFVGEVTATKITPDAGHASCVVTLNEAGSAFTMNKTAINQDVKAGATSTPVNGSLQMNDTGINQDSCQGAKLTISFTSN
jgi:hypothetical protein